ncbi:hypothetical protein [Rhizobium leucaenae]|uniref:hypothetical protein n=1 Tax=Rhizobium leucaenae TaxID=29450 RepID=UPI0004266D59|nr:hypothetical protein [Rhizobium leucaenae]
MGDHKGDPAKQPDICRNPVFTRYSEDFPRPPGGWGDGVWSKCPNIKEQTDYIDFDGEQYDCDVCGKSYYLDYEDMK